MFYHDQPSDPQPILSQDPVGGSPAFGVCPVCEARFNRHGSSHLPFCSARCRQIDLGRWLNESYGLPYEGEDRPPADPDDEED